MKSLICPLLALTCLVGSMVGPTVARAQNLGSKSNPYEWQLSPKTKSSPFDSLSAPGKNPLDYKILPNWKDRTVLPDSIYDQIKMPEPPNREFGAGFMQGVVSPLMLPIEIFNAVFNVGISKGCATFWHDNWEHCTVGGRIGFLLGLLFGCGIAKSAWTSTHRA